MTPIASVIIEEVSDEPPAETLGELRARMDWAGAAALEGSSPFMSERSVEGSRMNRLLHTLVDPDERRQFREDEDAFLVAADLTDEERDLVGRRDWMGMFHHGVIFFMLEKLGAVTGVGNIDIFAAMKGTRVPDYRNTRNAAITYAVAGKEAIT